MLTLTAKKIVRIVLSNPYIQLSYNTFLFCYFCLYKVLRVLCELCFLVCDNSVWLMPWLKNFNSSIFELSRLDTAVIFSFPLRRLWSVPIFVDMRTRTSTIYWEHDFPVLISVLTNGVFVFPHNGKIRLINS